MNANEIEAYLINRGLTPEWVTDDEQGAFYTKVRLGRLAVRFIQSYIACGSVGVTTHFPEEQVKKVVDLLAKAALLRAPVFVYNSNPSPRTGRIEGDLPREEYAYPMNELEDYADVLEYNPRAMRIEELSLSGRLKYARLAKGMSEQQLAETVGVCVEDVSHWESGAVPLNADLHTIATMLDMDPAEVANG